VVRRRRILSLPPTLQHHSHRPQVHHLIDQHPQLPSKPQAYRSPERHQMSWVR